MKNRIFRILAVVTLIAALLTGCTGEQLKDFWQELQGALVGSLVTFDRMEYTRPDPDAFTRMVDDCSKNAQTETDAAALMEQVYAVYEAYYGFYTNYGLADIHYCKDMTDIYWEEEYNYCLSVTSQIDAGLDELLYALAECPLKEELETEEYFGADFFDSYEGESIWDETFTELMNQEAELISRYYELSAESLTMDTYSEAFYNSCGREMADLYVKMIALRQQIAEYLGYDSYLQFAYEYYYYRDYTPEQAMDYIEEIRKELTPLYGKLSYDVWDPAYETVTEQEVFSYVKQAAQAMGGTFQAAFQLMEQGSLYDITYSENKYNASFELYLPNYYVPFVFLNPGGTGRDKLTFAHEFGHFCSDYAAGGSMVGVDVAEIFSQSMELLSLCYGEGDKALERMKLADSLCTFVEQSAFASFEHQAYLLTDEELTTENVFALYEKTCTAYGFDSHYCDGRDFVTIPHFFTNPLYVISYVVSNDAAIQYYQLEKKTAGEGVALLEDTMATQQYSFLAFLEEAGLASPFDPEAVAALRKTLEAGLK